MFTRLRGSCCTGTGDLTVGLQPPSDSFLQPSSADLTQHTCVSTPYWQWYTKPANETICVHDHGAELVSSTIGVDKTPAQMLDNGAAVWDQHATAMSSGSDGCSANTMDAALPVINVTLSTADSQGADSPFSTLAAMNDSSMAIAPGEGTAQRMLDSAVSDHTAESSIHVQKHQCHLPELTSASTDLAQQAATPESTSSASTTSDKAVRQDPQQAVAAAINEALGDSVSSEAHAQQTALLAPGRAEQVAALEARVRAHLLSEPHYWQDFLKEHKVQAISN